MPFSIAPLLRLTACLVLWLWPAVAVAADGGPPVPEPTELIDLVRTTMLAADTGNKSGDYSQLANLGTAAFKAANPVDKLATSFGTLRQAKIDLTPVQDMVPQTVRAPVLDRNGLLRIAGFFEFPEAQIVYDLLYSYDETAKAWQLAGISISPRALPEHPELMQPG